MVLSYPQIKSIILDNPNKALIQKGVDYNKAMRMHLYGENLTGALTTIDGMESATLQTLRVKYAKSNKDLFARLGRNCDKVFSARGGSVYYNLDNATTGRAAAMNLNITNGYSTKQWVQHFWLTHLKDDPMGLIFMEVGNGTDSTFGIAFPTYKAICDIYDYPAPKGSSLDYVCFKLSQNDKQAYGVDVDYEAYRIVDDAFDYIVKKDNGDVIVLNDLTFPNYFGSVPAIMNSDFTTGQDETIRVSLFDDLKELADHFLLKGSIKVTHEFLHGFPKYWEYADDCMECKGTGYKDADPCTKCKGTGRSLMTKVSDSKLMQYPQSKDDPIVTPNVAGYVEPSKTYYEISTTELGLLEDLMNFTLWGITDKHQAIGPDANSQPSKTATEIKDDNQPLVARLTSISESAEKRHKFIADMAIMINLKQLAYTGSSINYGRRYLIYNEDEAWLRYSGARKDGAPQATLDDLLRDYLETKYQGDPITLTKMLKFMALEPFVHLTIAQCEPLVELELDYIKKLYFWEWANTLINNEPLIYTLPMLADSLTQYATAKLAAIQQGRQDQAAIQLEQQKATAAIAAIKQGNTVEETVN